MGELYRSEYFVITLDEQRMLFHSTRTARPLASGAEVIEEFQAAVRRLEGFDRSRYVQLADVRLAPARDDPAFERIIKAYQPTLFAGFRRVAVLTKTEAGRLQITRLAQGTSINMRTFMDEASALAYLFEPEGQTRGADTRTPPRSW